MTVVDDIVVKRLGQAPYAPTLEAMRRFTLARTDTTPDELWLLEHPPVYTLGQGALCADAGGNAPLHARTYGYPAGRALAAGPPAGLYARAGRRAGAGCQWHPGARGRPRRRSDLSRPRTSSRLYAGRPHPARYQGEGLRTPARADGDRSDRPTRRAAAGRAGSLCGRCQGGGARHTRNARPGVPWTRRERRHGPRALFRHRPVRLPGPARHADARSRRPRHAGRNRRAPRAIADRAPRRCVKRA